MNWTAFLTGFTTALAIGLIPSAVYMAYTTVRRRRRAASRFEAGQDRP